ncbi:MAG: pyridoxal phosphate-dependent aminotransferase [Clostridiales bacterium]|nr:pyridoxal phosphate-dependent aminotransferase [Clostridiales bacterium]MCD8333498.1 pyridoxal phosphate-dependent aminotransferase [Clostridiales bacterium]
MTYDFDTVINRRGTSSLKWKVAENELPMWVADMDFQTAPPIRAAIQEQLDHGIFGYALLPEEWYTSIIRWWDTRHALSIERDWLIFCTGVIPAISTSVRKLTSPGENVLIQTPVYNMFFNCIVNNGRNVLENPLIYDRETASYRIDWEDLENKLANPQTSMMILCNPHNPIGKIWDRDTLARIGELCARHHVIVISDEIHCDLTEPGRGYIPFASVSETCRDNSITCIAPTKAFNIAGLHSAAVIVPDKFLRHKVWRALNTDEVAEPNSFASAVSIAAFTEGGEWLDVLRAYISENRKRVGEYIENEIPSIRLVPSEATYLLWLDCTDVWKKKENLAAFIRKETGLYLSNGAAYGKTGEGFLRMNIACPRSTLEDGLQRLKAGIAAYEKLPL